MVLLSQRASCQPAPLATILTAFAWSAIAVLSGLGCGAGAKSGAPPNTAGPRPAATVPAGPQALGFSGQLFDATEHLEARFAVNGFPAGQLTVDVVLPCRLADSVAVPVRSSGRSGGLAGLLKRQWSEATSWLDQHTGRPLVYTEQYEMRKTVRHLQVDFRVVPSHYHTTYQFGQRPVRYKLRKLPVEQPVYGVASFLAVLRHWRPAAGQRVLATVLLRRRLWRVELTYAGPDRVKLGGVPVTAIRIDGVAQKLKASLEPTKTVRKFAIWLSDDDDRVPVRAEAKGKRDEFTIELIDYQRGRPWSRAPSAPAACAASARP